MLIKIRHENIIFYVWSLSFLLIAVAMSLKLE